MTEVYTILGDKHDNTHNNNEIWKESKNGDQAVPSL